MRLGASAPGKVVLCGEYAVVDGAPAVGMAVNRRAVVTAAPSESDCHVLLAPGLADGRRRFRAPGGRIDWLDAPPPGSGLIERLWQRLPPAADCWRLTLDSTAFVDAACGRKLGLGASAAVAAAASAVLARLAGDETAAATHAAGAHRDFQGGHGSGIDVAVSLNGGIVEFRTGRLHEPRRLDWPAGLHCRFLWSGTPASTAEKLSRWQSGRPMAEPDDAFAALKRLSREAARCWRGGDGQAVLESLAHYTAALRRFDEAHTLGIFDAGHAALADAAAAVDAVYKPCGAGGGDVGAVFAADAAAAEKFLERAVESGFATLDLEPDDNGVGYMNTRAR